jgi:serine-type D-Ala-D-Ala carboxypeptidase (penicillin-binding protein 5/6)
MRRLRCSAVNFSHRISLSFFALALFLGGARGLHAAQAYIIADSQTGFVLEEHESKQKRQVGSLTKVATAIVTLDWAEKRSGDLNQVAIIPPEAFAGSVENKIGFQPGDAITLRDLLYAALVQSDNVAAYTLAAYVGEAIKSIVPQAAGSKPQTSVGLFVDQMNALAAQLKMDRTHFVNPHGIDDNVRPLPYSSAMDMARLARHAMNRASFRFYVSQKERQIEFTRGKHRQGYLLRNTNELLGQNGIDGVKTGSTAHAGDCLILSANREAQVVRQGQGAAIYPRHLIIVVLGSTNRFGEGSGLVGRGWQLYDQWVAGGRLVDQQKLL